MKLRAGDKVPVIRISAVRALSRFASDCENSDILDLFLDMLPLEQTVEVRKTIVLSLPPSNVTAQAIIDSTLDVSESVRKAAYCVLASKFPLQSLSIKHRTLILQRGLADRSVAVSNECLKLLKDEWLIKCCRGDPLELLKFLDVETYEFVGESVADALLKAGLIKVRDGENIQQYTSAEMAEDSARCTPSIQLMEAEVALYWRMICRHLQMEAQAKGSDAASTMGTEAAVYAAEASDSNDLLEQILPATISDYIDLVKAHIDADATNRKVASTFVLELLHKPFDHEVDQYGDMVVIGDGINLGGDKDWAEAVSGLARKVHAASGEFEEVVLGVVEEIARPCRERTADFMQWMHCLAVFGLCLEKARSYHCIQGRATEPAELLQSLLLPAAKHSHLEVQRIAVRCLGLFGLLEKKPSQELVKQLKVSFVKGPAPISIIACKALFDLGMWHNLQEVDRVVGQDVLSQHQDYDITSSPLNFSDTDGISNIKLLDLLYAGLIKDDWDNSLASDENESVQGALGEGFAKKCISKSFITVMRSMWPGINGNAGGSAYMVSNMRKRAVQAPLYKNEMEDGNDTGKVPEVIEEPPLECGEEGLAIRIATEVATFHTKKTPAEKSYVSALCRILVLLHFRLSEQGAIQLIRRLLIRVAESVSAEKDLVKELRRMADHLKALDRHPDQEMSQDQANLIFGRLELDFNMDFNVSVEMPQTPAPCSTKPTRRRKQVRLEEESSDEDSSPTSVVPNNLGTVSARSQRASKTAALSKMTAKQPSESMKMMKMRKAQRLHHEDSDGSD
ncbi:ARM repeat superfamily protein [Prunus dulcis]|uniref:ARM repeat superfamily protein n=1 Tax=Prunus dulcis TaxID=3755 RepID=A0A4Y1R3G7_PRUDU|nr:ARM repeat superfamily protein [Prunus dulcis]